MNAFFYIAVALMTLIALAFLLWPLLRKGAGTDGTANQQAQDALFRQHRVTELQADVESGILDAAQLEQARAEIERMGEVASDGSATRYKPSADRSALVKITAVLTVLALPVLSIALYAAYQGWPTADQMVSAQAESGETPSVEQMVSGLASRLEQNPNDLDGWIMLGRSYRVMNRYTEAVQAYRKANELSGEKNADILVAEAATLGLARDRDLLGRPQQLFAQALAISPENLAANWYSGLIGMQLNDPATAIRYFEKTLSLNPPPDFAKAIEEQLALARQQAGIAAPKTPQANAAQTSSNDDGETRLVVSVSVSPKIQAQFEPSTAVFVFARAPGGPPMPLAVSKLTLADLPTRIRLDDSMAMMPGMNLNAHEQWQVVARISRSGQPGSQVGDAMAQRLVDRAGTETVVSLVINSLVE